MWNDKMKFKEAKKNFLKQQEGIVIHKGTTLSTDRNDRNGDLAISTIGQMVGDTGHRWLIEFMKNLGE